MSDINIGEIAEALNDKTDRDLMNVDTGVGADAVIEYRMPTAENDYNWYRKYKSGWVEQGGRYDYGSLAADFAATVTIPVAMYDNNYTALVSASRNNENAAYRNGYCTIFTKNTTQLGFGFYGQDGNHKMQYLDWYIAGKVAV